MLRIFETLYLDRNVSKAAKRLGLSQPALSHALSRLRDDFDDELFVRSGRGVTPTPKASQQIHAVRQILDQSRALYSDTALDIAKINGRFTIATTDYEEHVLLPALLPRLSTAAPGIQVVIRPTLGALPKTDLENGVIDLAIAGFFGELPEGFYRSLILEETYVCVVRANHPKVDKSLTLDTFVSLEHLLVSPQSDLVGAVDEALGKKKLKRRIVAGLGNFHTPAAVVAVSDIVATLPKRIAEAYAPLYGLRIFPVPLPVKGFKLTAVWHARTHQSPVHAWMRKQIHEAGDW